MAAMEATSDIVCELRKNRFLLRPKEERWEILRAGRTTPDLKGLQKDGNTVRQFQSSWYDCHKWIAGSAMTNKIYCWPCLLFTKKKSTWSNEGYCDWKNLSRAACVHSSSREHIQSEMSLRRMEKEGELLNTVPSQPDRFDVLQYNENVRKNREVLKRMTDLSVIFSRQKLAFHEQDDRTSQGSYRELVDFFFLHNDELRAHWLTNSATFAAQFGEIQDQLTECLADEVMLHIQQEVRESRFLACQLDEPAEVSDPRRASLILRFVDKNGATQERFLGFKTINTSPTPESLKEMLDSVLNPEDYKNKLVSQSYDGAILMAADLGGLPALVKQDAPQALFVHSHSHRLDAVLQQGAQRITETRCFFATLKGFPEFFIHCGQKNAMLARIVGRKIPFMCTVQWESRSSVLQLLVAEREKLCDVYQEIVDGPGWDCETRRQASGYLNALRNFHFIFLTLTYSRVFSLTDVLCGTLKKKPGDVKYCTSKVQAAIQKIEELKQEVHFTEIFDTASACSCENGSPQPKVKRIREDGSPGREADTYARLYKEILDDAVQQISGRFADVKALGFLELADTSRFPAFGVFPSEAFQSLSELHGRHFDLDRLKNELAVVFRDEQFKKCSPWEVHCVIVQTQLGDVLKEVQRLFCLIATMPLPTLNAESSFTGLKRIKAYLRSAAEVGHFSSLATISIESELLAFLEKQPTWYNDIIKRFISKKNRNIPLVYQ